MISIRSAFGQLSKKASSQMVVKLLIDRHITVGNVPIDTGVDVSTLVI